MHKDRIHMKYRIVSAQRSTPNQRISTWIWHDSSRKLVSSTKLPPSSTDAFFSFNASTKPSPLPLRHPDRLTHRQQTSPHCERGLETSRRNRQPSLILTQL